MENLVTSRDAGLGDDLHIVSAAWTMAVGGVMGKFDVSGFDHNYLRQRAAIINRPDCIASARFCRARRGGNVAEENGGTSGTTDKEHNGKLDAGRALPRRRRRHRRS